MAASVLPKGAPRPVVTWEKARRIWHNLDIWRDPKSVVHRLPDHYKKRYWANVLADKTPVHYTPPQERYTWQEKKAIWCENEHVPVQVIYPPEADDGLWGGEGIVKGYLAVKKKTRRPQDRPKPIRWYPRFLWPRLMDRVFYCEIFDKYLKIRSTRGAAELIDAHFGLDYYILKTSEIDLCSKLGNKLKREMLLALARGDYHHNDSDKRKEISEKFAEFVIPEEEAEWVGLDLNEACKKLQDLEDTVPPAPLKFKFEQELVNDIANEKSGKDSWLKKITGAKYLMHK